MEKDLYNWYQSKRRSAEPVTARMIKDKAIQLSTCRDFIASKGWLDKFKIRYRLEIAKESTQSVVGQLHPQPSRAEDQVNSSLQSLV